MVILYVWNKVQNVPVESKEEEKKTHTLISLASMKTPFITAKSVSHNYEHFFIENCVHLKKDRNYELSKWTLTFTKSLQNMPN